MLRLSHQFQIAPRKTRRCGGSHFRFNLPWRGDFGEVLTDGGDNTPPKNPEPDAHTDAAEQEQVPGCEVALNNITRPEDEPNSDERTDRIAA